MCKVKVTFRRQLMIYIVFILIIVDLQIDTLIKELVLHIQLL